MVHAKTHNFFVKRITDPTELSMPIEDARQVAVEKRKWNETRASGNGDDGATERWMTSDDVMPTNRMWK
jgi:hypothetical protein